ncbi:MAG: hypothetical protein RLZZ507_4262 [Cyanobacteriota bacterium]|jgi:hypothetical protein
MFDKSVDEQIDILGLWFSLKAYVKTKNFIQLVIS